MNVQLPVTRAPPSLAVAAAIRLPFVKLSSFVASFGGGGGMGRDCVSFPSHTSVRLHLQFVIHSSAACMLSAATVAATANDAAEICLALVDGAVRGGKTRSKEVG